MEWGMIVAAFAAVATIIATVIAAAAFVRTGVDAAKTRLTNSIAEVKHGLAAHEGKCETRHVDIEHRLTTLEAARG